jgi:hypothetical protein
MEVFGDFAKLEAWEDVEGKSIPLSSQEKHAEWQEGQVVTVTDYISA